MPTLFERVVSWLARKAGSLLLILAILLAAGWVRSEWALLAELQASIERTESIRSGLQAQVDQLDAHIARAAPHWRTALLKFADVERQAGESRRQADAARAARDTAEAAARFWHPLTSPERVVELQEKRVRAATLEQVARSWEVARDQVARKLEQSPVQRLSAERDLKQLDLAAATELLDSQQRRLATDPTRRLLGAARAALPTALWILAGLMLAPLLVKTLLYFVFAPLAARLAPIRVLPNAAAAALPTPTPSAVSLPCEVAAGEEILVHADFLQSSSQPAAKQTQWFLNWRLPFTSLASGMFILTRIRPEGALPTRVVVSAKNDAFGEVGSIRLPEGAAMVVQPRALAGVIKPVGPALRITRHWRLASLHAWLTLQLRYLVFHGPCTLVLKGSRGVRAERPQPGSPRLIDQSATLGFSANLEYRNTRSETFVAYLRGKESLFNDLFAGGPGVFVYEEMPAGGRRGGLLGRGIEGALDAALKTFGI
jgi:uncharacterized protein (AIM24 family)